MGDVIFTPLKHSTGSVKFKLSNVSFIENKLIKKIAKIASTIKKTCDTKRASLCMVGCNYGEVLIGNYTRKPKKSELSNRGRKKQNRDAKSRRKVQGTGKYFNSQITFFVKLNLLPYKVYVTPEKRKLNDQDYEFDLTDSNADGECRLKSYIYKIKVFRNGNGQIPGLRTELKKEIKQILKPIQKIMSQLMCKVVEANKFDRFIQNYKSKITNNNHYEMRHLKNYFNTLPIGPHPNQIFRIKESSHSKLLVYFNTPMKHKKDKCTNLTIYRKGSINIDGSVGRASADKILDYFNALLIDNPKFLFDPNADSSSSDSSDSDDSSFSDDSDSGLSSSDSSV